MTHRIEDKIGMMEEQAPATSGTSAVLDMQNESGVGVIERVSSSQPSNNAVNMMMQNSVLPHSLNTEEYEKDKKRRHRCKTTMACVLLGVVVPSALIGVLAATTSIFSKSETSSSPQSHSVDKTMGKATRTIEEQDSYFAFLVDEIFGSRWVTLESSDPARKAVEWLAYQDPLHLQELPKIFQRYALAVLYFGQGGPLWSLHAENDGWMENSDGMLECRWKGVDCDADGAVIGIRLGAPGVLLTGQLVPELALLSDLQHLNLSNNRLKGSIPKELFGLTSLVTLNLSANSFLSSISEEIKNLSNLRVFNVHQNELSGSLPLSSVESLGSLETIKISKNVDLEANLGELISVLPENLVDLEVSDTQISGSIPASIAKFQGSLEVLTMHQTNIQGSIATELGLLTNLKYLDLGKTKMQGVIPSELGNLSRLEALDIHGLLTKGTFPTEFGSLSSLKRLDLTFYGLTGTLPTQLGTMTSLQYLKLESNSELTGQIPSEVGLLTSLSHLEVMDTGLTGSVPEQVCSNYALTSFRADCGSGSNGIVEPKIQCDCCTECQTGK